MRYWQPIWEQTFDLQTALSSKFQQSNNLFLLILTVGDRFNRPRVIFIYFIYLFQDSFEIFQLKNISEAFLCRIPITKLMRKFIISSRCIFIRKFLVQVLNHFNKYLFFNKRLDIISDIQVNFNIINEDNIIQNNHNRILDELKIIQLMYSSYNWYKQEYLSQQEDRTRKSQQYKSNTMAMRKIYNLNMQVDVTAGKINQGKVYVLARTYNKSRFNSRNQTPFCRLSRNKTEPPLPHSSFQLVNKIKYQNQSTDKLRSTNQGTHKNNIIHCNSLIQKLGTNPKILHQKYKKQKINSTQTAKKRSKSLYIVRKQILSTLMKVKGKQVKKTPEQNNQQLTKFQIQEIKTKNYQVIYKGKRRLIDRKEFTDRDGFPNADIGDSILYRYEKRTWSIEYKCMDHKQKNMVLMKIFRVSTNLTNMANKQIQILKKAINYDLMAKSNVVRMIQNFVFRYHICITYEMLSYSLTDYMIINKSEPIAQPTVIKLAINILYSMIFLSTNKIIHFALTPHNIRLKQLNKTALKLTNFLYCRCDQYRNQIVNQNLAYRAPEIILGHEYTSAIDIWTFGCLIAQLMTGYRLFDGKCQKQQISLYIQLIGYPPRPLLEKGQRTYKIFNEDLSIKISPSSSLYRAPKSLTFQKALNCQNKQFIELIKKCIMWDPSKRITPSQVLLHEWILSGVPEDIKADHIKRAIGFNRM